MTNQAKVGIFSTITVAIFILGFYFLKGIDLFERKNTYYAVYERVDGLYKSNQVEINGFTVGRVADMQRDPSTGKIVVKLDLITDLKIPDSDSTSAQLFSTDFLGTKKIRLVFGTSDTYLKEGDTIPTYFKRDLTEQIGSEIDPIIHDVKHIVPTLDTTIVYIKYLFDPRNPRGIYTTLGEVNNAIAKVNDILVGNEIALQQTIKNLEGITGNIQKNNQQITNILKNFSDVSDSLEQANLKQTIENLNKTITELNQVAADINQGKGTLGKIIKEDDLYTSIDTAVSNLNKLLLDVKQRPYRYITINVLGSKKAEERREKKFNESGK
ncbi:MAG: MCE family protein [Chitinophagales bacterium]|nr:MCE family protein [Chitinophagales bacterium]